MIVEFSFDIIEFREILLKYYWIWWSIIEIILNLVKQYWNTIEFGFDLIEFHEV